MHTLQQLRSGQLAGIKRLDLACELTSFPTEIFDLADSLEVLNLSGNRLSSLPDLQRLTKLKVLFCSNNAFDALPEHLGSCPSLRMIGFKSNRIEHVPATALPPQLRWLILTDNQLTQLPDELGQCQGLEKLALAGNRLTHLPESLQHCHDLGLLRISANQLTTLPTWLTQMPKLAWLAYGSNAFNSTPNITRHAWPSIPWSSLHLQHLLGEGASGHIHAGTWQQNGAHPNPQAVAVKIFKGALTSDGLPELELQTCQAAGSHPNLIPIHGQVPDHPAGLPALVMQQLDGQWRALAGSPSLDTCTRDVYDPHLRLSTDTTWRIAQSVASAGTHLHERGLLHGDLYAHNILWREPGQAYLGDFGAASFLPANASQAKAAAQLEACAYGHLLEELCRHASAPTDPRIQRLMNWQMQCTQAHVPSRPTLADIDTDLRH